MKYDIAYRNGVPYIKPRKYLQCTYVEYRAVSGVFQNIGGSIFWKTPDVGLASYSTYNLSTMKPLRKLVEIQKFAPTLAKTVVQVRVKKANRREYVQ